MMTDSGGTRMRMMAQHRMTLHGARPADEVCVTGATDALE